MSKATFSLAFLLCLLTQAQAFAVIYGTDDRREVGAFAPARSTALQVPMNYVTPTANGTLTLDFPSLSDAEDIKLCPEERFSAQRASPIACTGFLVAPDLLATAGHCMVNWTKVENTMTPQCESFGWLFDYQLSESGEAPAVTGVPADKLFRCQRVVYANFEISLDPKTGKVLFGEDIALIQLDRPTTGRKSFTPEFRPPQSNELFSLVGYPLGLPAKATSSARMVQSGDQYFFRTNFDSQGGNSGSPVISGTGGVLGVLVRSFPDADLVEDRERGCRVWNRCEANFGNCREEFDPFYAKGTEIQRIDALRRFLLARP